MKCIFRILCGKNYRKFCLFLNSLTDICYMYEFNQENCANNIRPFVEDGFNIYHALLSLCANCRYHLLRLIRNDSNLMEIEK